MAGASVAACGPRFVALARGPSLHAAALRTSDLAHRPSAVGQRDMVLLLAETLTVPFRECNHLLLAAGYAPAFPERSLQHPELAPVREALDLTLTGH